MIQSKILLSALLITPLLLTGCKSDAMCDSAKYDCTPLDKKVEVSPNIQVYPTPVNQPTQSKNNDTPIKESTQKPLKPETIKAKTIEQEAYDAMASKIEEHYKPFLAKKTDHLYDYIGFHDMQITSQSGDAFDFTFTIELIRAGNPENTSECDLEGWYNTVTKQVGFDDVPESCL